MARSIRISQPVSLLAIVFLVFIVGYWFFALPLFRSLGASLNELAIDNVPVASTKTGAAAERAKQISELKDSVEKLIPSEDKQYDLAVQVENVAKNSGVGLTAFSLNPIVADVPKATVAATEDDEGNKASAPAATAAPAPTTRQVSIALTIAGTYGNIQNFINQLTSIDRFIQITQINVASSQSSSAGTTGALTDQVTATIAAQAYYLPQK